MARRAEIKSWWRVATISARYVHTHLHVIILPQPCAVSPLFGGGSRSGQRSGRGGGDD